MKSITIIATICLLLVSSVSTQAQSTFESIVNYLDQQNLGVNSPWLPASISAYDTYQLLDSNILVIDVRSAEDYSRGHIEGAVNINFKDLLVYLEDEADASSFSKIVITCNTGQTAGYATGILRFVGYGNVFNMRFGMSGWHMAEAERVWLPRLSNRFADKLEFTPNNPPAPQGFPTIETTHNDAAAILRERALKLFSEGLPPATINADTLFSSGHSILVVSYLPEDIYNQGHIPGAVHYTPKQSLGFSQLLSTLPANRPIALYCYSGNHTGFVAAYLRLMGYDARNVLFGINGFMHGYMQQEGIRGIFNADRVENLPVVSD